MADHSVAVPTSRMNEIYARAERLAYLGSVDKIMAALANEYGRDRPLPSIATIRGYVEARRKPAPQRRDVMDIRPFDDDGGDWHPRGLVQLVSEHKRELIREAGRTEEVVSIAPRLPSGAPATPSEVLEAVGRFYFVSVADIIGRCRMDHLTRARNTAAYALRERGNSIPKIGQLLGGRDHSTISNSLKRFREKATGAEWELVTKLLRRAA